MESVSIQGTKIIVIKNTSIVVSVYEKKKERDVNFLFVRDKFLKNF